MPLYLFITEMHRRRNNRIKPEFKVEYIPTVTRYDPILDRNL